MNTQDESENEMMTMIRKMNKMKIYLMANNVERVDRFPFIHSFA
jgi:hypothetical protein